MQGKNAIAFLETLVVGDIAALADGTGTLSVFTNEKGGIIDDTVITKVCSGRKSPPPPAHFCCSMYHLTSVADQGGVCWVYTKFVPIAGTMYPQERATKF